MIFLSGNSQILLFVKLLMVQKPFFHKIIPYFVYLLSRDGVFYEVFVCFIVFLRAYYCYNLCLHSLGLPDF